LGAPSSDDVPAPELSGAALLHAVFEAGLEAVRLGAQEARYALRRISLAALSQSQPPPAENDAWSHLG